MPDEGLQKQVLPAAIDGTAEMVTLKRKIDALQKLYIVLFVTSLVILVIGFGGMPYWGHVSWAVTLGGAVITRLGRQSLVNKYNRALMGGGPAPLT